MAVVIATGLIGCEKGEDEPRTPQPREAGGPLSTFVEVDGVNIHYLDWGGVGEVLLLLAGLNNTPYIFSDLAPQFTDRFRVIGMSRRGHGLSDRPETGYDLNTRVEDIRGLLDALRAGTVSIVGHSIAGAEMRLFAERYPVHVERLVLLEAAYDGEAVGKLMERAPPPPPLPEDAAEDVMKAHFVSLVFGGALTPPVEEELRYAIGVAPEVAEALLASDAATGFDFTGVATPTLAIFAVPDPKLYLPPTEDLSYVAEMERFWTTEFAPFQQEEIRRFEQEAPNGRVAVVQKSHHYVFLHSEAEVVQLMREFLLSPGPG
jgi:pimeloyl-ACP methyl ester carboxylesterase